MTTNYTTKTASLKATQADIRKVEATKLMVSPDGKSTSKKEDVLTLIKNAADSAAIQVGRDANKDWSVANDEITTGVKKINFMGDFVNVVPGANGEVSLYIGENKSLAEADKKNLNGTPSNSTDVIVYNDGVITLPVTAGGSTKAYSVVSAGGTFSSATMTAKADDGTEEFTLNQSENIWVRTTHEGTTSDWGKVSLKKARGVDEDDTEDVNVYTTTKVSFSPDTTTTDADGNLLYNEIALPDGVTMNVANYPLGTKNAKDGKIPNRCQTKFEMTVAYNTIANAKRGGTVLLEWIIAEALEGGTAPAITESAPTNKISVFLTEKKTPVLADYASGTPISVSVSSKAVDAVSGLYYATKNSKISVSTGSISDSQYKSATTNNRLVISCAGGSKTLTTGDLSLSDADAGKAKTDSGVTYKGASNVEVTLGATQSSNAKVSASATAYGYSNGNTKSAEVTGLSPWWGDISKNSSNQASSGTVERWVKEYARYKDITAQTAFGNTLNVLDNGVTIKGTETVGAVAQFGELMHPDAAVAAFNSAGESFKYADTDKAASYIRKFSGITTGAGFKITGTNIGASGIKVYWYDNLGLNDLVDISVPNSQNTVSANSIQHNYDGPNGEKATTAPIIVIIIPHGSTTKIGALTVSHV